MHRPPDAGRPARARRWRRSPTGRCATSSFRLLGREDGRHPPRRAGAEVRRADVPGAGRSKHPTPALRAQGRVLPRLRRELLRARAGRDDRRAARAQRDRGRGPEAGLLRAAAAVQRHVRRRARRTCTGSPSGSRRTRARAIDIVGTSTSCTLMLKREALEILGMGDDEELRGGLRARVRHLRVPAHAARARRAQDRLRAARADGHLPRAVPAAGSRDRQAGARPAGADPGPERRREHARTAAASRARTGSSARSTASRWTSARPLFRQIADDGSDRAVCDSETCRWQIEQATGVHTVHPVEMLAPRRRPRLSRGRPRHRLAQRGAGRGRGRARRARWAARTSRSQPPAGWTTARSAPTPSGCGGGRRGPLARRRARADGPRQRADERGDGGRDDRARRRADRAHRGAAGRGRRCSRGTRARRARTSPRSRRRRARRCG